MILSTLKKLNKIYKDTGFSYKYIFLLSFVTSLTLSVFEGFFLGVIFNLTSSLLGKTYQTINFFENSIFDFQNLNEILILCAVIIIFITLLKILNIFFNTYLYFKINTVVSKKIFKKILFQSIDFHKNINSSKIISTLSEKSKSVGEITFFLLSILRCTCILLMITISTIYISSKEFVLITLIFFLLYFLIYLIFKKKMNNYGIDIANQNDKIIKNIQESLSSIIFILLYKSQKSISNKFYKIVSSLRKSQAKVVFLASVPFIFVQTFGFLLIIYLIYLFDVKDNFVTLIPFLAMGLVAIQRLLPNFNEIFSSISTIKALEQNFIDTQNLVDLKINEVNFDKKINEVNFSKNIRFENVNFSYEKNKFVLNDINLQIQKNSIFGIMGSTGSGKSTIVNLLLGFNRPDKGNIYIDDKILSDSEILNWQENLSYVPQRVYLLDDTIITNITLEEKTNKVNFDLLNEAVKFAELEKFISLQKDGIHHVIGEDADKISGGQKQRIGIARAIYKNTNTLILDESLNSLDNNTKERILNKFKSINKTIVLISHQKNDLKICDEIFEI